MDFSGDGGQTPIRFSATHLQYIVGAWRPPDKKSICDFCGKNQTEKCPFRQLAQPSDGYCSDFEQVPFTTLQERIIADIDSNPPLTFLITERGVVAE